MGSVPKASEVKQQQAKARRVIATEGKGGVRPSRGLAGFAAKGKRTEQKKAKAAKGFGKQAGLLYDRRPPSDAPCACNTGETYSECCEPLHDGTQHAATPEALVRARYCAYRYRVPDFLIDTTDPEGEEFEEDRSGWRKTLLQFCDDFEFQGLRVEEAVVDQDAKVSFQADFTQKGTPNLTTLKELSTFRKTEDGIWLYAKGEVDYEAQS